LLLTYLLTYLLDLNIPADIKRHWRRPRGRPRATWLRAIDTDVQPVNIEIHSAWRKASDHTLGRRIVDTATLRHRIHRARGH